MYFLIFYCSIKYIYLVGFVHIVLNLYNKSTRTTA